MAHTSALRVERAWHGLPPLARFAAAALVVAAWTLLTFTYSVVWFVLYDRTLGEHRPAGAPTEFDFMPVGGLRLPTPVDLVVFSAVWIWRVVILVVVPLAPLLWLAVRVFFGRCLFQRRAASVFMAENGSLVVVCSRFDELVVADYRALIAEAEARAAAHDAARAAAEDDGCKARLGLFGRRAARRAAAVAREDDALSPLL